MAYATSDYTAFAIEQVLKRDWTFQVTQALPLLACIKDRDLKWNNGVKISGTKILVPVVTSLVSGMTASSAGVADANQIPSAWPTWDGTEGFNQAAYELTHLERPMVVTESDRVIGGGTSGARGNLIDGKTTQLMATFKQAMADQIAGSSADSRTRLMGLGYALSQSNTVGGLDQVTVTNWRAGLTSATGTLSLQIVNNAFDQINNYANETGKAEAPDLLLLSFASGGINTYGRMRELIAPGERFENQDFKTKYGISNFEYMGLKCVQDGRGAAGTAHMLSTSTWFYAGNDKPKQLSTQRIPGSSAEERMYVQWCAVGCDEIRRNHRIAGITG